MSAAATPTGNERPLIRDVTIAPGAEAIDARLSEMLGSADDGSTLKDNAVRRVFRAAAPAPWRSAIVKIYKKARPLAAAKHAIVGKPCAREWRGIARVRAAGLAAPEPLATGVVGGRPFLVTAEIPGARTAGSLLRESRDRAERGALLEAVARLAAGLARASLFHRDLHTGNFLVGSDGRLRIIDLHTLVAMPPLAPFWRAADRARLFQSLLDMTTRTERLRFVRAYAEASGRAGAARAWFRAAERRARSLERRRIRSRTKRCVVRSTEFWFEEIPGARVFYRRSFGRDAALAAVAGHERAAGANVLKNGRRTKVTRVSPLTASFPAACVKEHRVRGLRDLVRNVVWRGRARNEWMAGHALFVLGLATPRTLALVEGRGRRSSFVVTEFAPALAELDRSIHEEWSRGTPPSQRRPLIRLAAELVSTLHARRLYHNDLKAKNLLLGRREQGGEPTLWIIDLTGVRVGRRFTPRRRIKNLAQLDTSLPPEVTETDRLRFLREYLLLLRSHEDRKALARAVGHAGRHRVNYWTKPKPPPTPAAGEVSRGNAE